MFDPEDIISHFRLQPHPVEGGFYAETYRASEVIPAGEIAERYGSPRSLSTAIYFLLTPESFSRVHRLKSDEIFHFYLGDPVEMLQLHPDGTGRMVLLGSDFPRGMELQAVVPRGVWQGARLRQGGRFALMGTTVAPGYDPSDLELGRREELVLAYPDFRRMITALTPPED